jgi:hypothetical protein
MSRRGCSDTGFGWIEIDGERYEHDVLIRLDGTIKKRKKQLSKRIYGTSHTISLDEAKHVYEKGARVLVVGTGQDDNVRLSPEAEGYFEQRGCRVQLLATPAALGVWNEAGECAIGLFHVTC